MIAKALNIVCRWGLIFLWIVVAWACGPRPGAEQTAAPLPPAALRTEADSLQVSVQTDWMRLAASETRQLRNLGRLLDEISYVPEHDRLAVARLQMHLERLDTLRYDEVSVAESDRIDRFDAGRDSLVTATVRLAASTPNVEAYPLIEELVNDIYLAQDSVLIYRITYDRRAKAYNAFLTARADQLRQLGTPYQGWRSRPLFELPE